MDTTTHSTTNTFEEQYLSLMLLMMMGKHRLINIGADYGLTGMQVMTLILLQHPRPMHSFKEIFNCDASNVTGIIDGLEEKNLVARAERPDDRRIKLVKLLEHGRKTRNAIMSTLVKGGDDNLLSNLDADETKTFIALVQKITSSATSS